MSGYWPWWLGAIALGTVTTGYAWIVQRSLGVSGAWDRVIHWRREREQERQDASWRQDEAQLVAALASVTAEEFGPPRPTGPTGPLTPGAGAPHGSGLDADRWQPPDVAGLPRQRHLRRSLPAPPVPVAFQVIFLVSVFLGGLVAAFTSGRFQLRADMGEGFSRIVTDSSPLMLGLLFGGGVLVGFGTRLAGGCSSGHGLAGCSRLQPVSLVATAVFFGTAVVVSLLLLKVI